MIKLTTIEKEYCLRMSQHFKNYYHERKTDSNIINVIFIVEFLAKNKGLEKLQKEDTYLMIDEKGIFYL